jgi:hypothetical protein
MKKKKFNKKKFWKEIEVVLFVLAIFALIFYVAEHWKGIHNVDLSWNAERLECSLKEKAERKINEVLRNSSIAEVNFQLTDVGSDFIERPMEEYYIIGMNQITRSQWMALICLFYIGLFIGNRILK